MVGYGGVWLKLRSAVVDYSGVRWCTVMYGGVRWLTVVYDGVRWCKVKYDAVWWCMMVCGGVRRCVMVYGGVRWCMVGMVGYGGVWWCTAECGMVVYCSTDQTIPERGIDNFLYLIMAQCNSAFNARKSTRRLISGKDIDISLSKIIIKSCIRFGNRHRE